MIDFLQSIPAHQWGVIFGIFGLGFGINWVRRLEKTQKPRSSSQEAELSRERLHQMVELEEGEALGSIENDFEQKLQAMERGELSLAELTSDLSDPLPEGKEELLEYIEKLRRENAVAEKKLGSDYDGSLESIFPGTSENMFPHDEEEGSSSDQTQPGIG